MGGRRLMLRRSWVQIPAPYTGWTFFTFIGHFFVVKNCNAFLKIKKINQKEAGYGPFEKTLLAPYSILRRHFGTGDSSGQSFKYPVIVNYDAQLSEKLIIPITTQ